jgi:hypothetical protein
MKNNLSLGDVCRAVVSVRRAHLNSDHGRSRATDLKILFGAKDFRIDSSSTPATFDNSRAAAAMASSSANVPSGASAAVLKPSEPMPEFAVSVEGPNFDVPVTLDNLLDSYARIGFQAHSLGRAIDIVNKMVMYQYVYPVYFSHIATAAKLEAFGRTNGRRRVR